MVIDGTVYAVYAVGCALWHELWHVLILKIVGGGVQNFALRGFTMKLAITNIGYSKETAVALAGPLASLTGFFVFSAIEGKQAAFLALSNLALFAVNIMPIYPLDGGRALYCLLCKHLTLKTAATVTRIISCLFLLPLTAFSVIMLIRTGYNLSLMLICGYLGIMLIGLREI